MMTSTIGAVFLSNQSSQWTQLFAQEPDKDLDFDEGLEEDELHQSKPPSRRPILWILLILLMIGIGYWILKSDTSFMSAPNPMDRVETNSEQIRQNLQSDIALPTFHENQKVLLSDGAGNSILMGDPSNTKPGPLVKSGEILTILDGSYQPTGWVYQVRTQAGDTGWISADTLKKHS